MSCSSVNFPVLNTLSVHFNMEIKLNSHILQLKKVITLSTATNVQLQIEQ